MNSCQVHFSRVAAVGYHDEEQKCEVVSSGPGASREG